MIEESLINLKSLLLERDDMDAGVVQQVRTALSESPYQYTTLLEITDSLQRSSESGEGDSAKMSLKLGVCNFFLGRMRLAADLLHGCRGSLGRFYQALALNEIGEHEQALRALESAARSGYAATEVALHKAAALRKLGRFEKALETLNSLEEYVHSTGEYLYQHGALLSTQGDDGAAVAYFEQAVQTEPRHGGALFQLAYYNDSNGNDETAISLYERCLQIPPAHVGTLINLGILYEDAERYDKACYCYEQVLKFYPNHARAKLFLRDSAASRSQEYDEDAERLHDRYNAVLDIPVTDFELSVRSRNCLKKMNIMKIGDLTRCTEQQLLASKNFGETSLTEIKSMLHIKGLRLGQTIEQQSKRSLLAFNLDDYSPQEQALFTRPVSDLNLSVRARKCMNRLGVTTIGELISHTGDELLECKNFGITSLVEVRDKLKTMNLTLRGD